MAIAAVGAVPLPDEMFDSLTNVGPGFVIVAIFAGGTDVGVGVLVPCDIEEVVLDDEALLLERDKLA